LPGQVEGTHDRLLRAIRRLAGGLGAMLPAVMVPYALMASWLWPVASVAAMLAWQITRWTLRGSPFPACQGEVGDSAAAGRPPPAGCTGVLAGQQDRPAAVRSELADFVSLAERRGMKGLQMAVLPGTGEEFRAGSFPLPTHPAIFLSQGMAGLLDRRELRTVLAHELAHLELKHTPKALLGAAGAELAALAAVVCVVLWQRPISAGWPGAVSMTPHVILTWLVCRLALALPAGALLRRQELAADRLAARITGDPQAFVSACGKLAARKGAGRPAPARVTQPAERGKIPP